MGIGIKSRCTLGLCIPINTRWLEEEEFRTQVSTEVEAPPGFEIKISNVAGGVCQAAKGSHAKVLNVAASGNGECQGEQSDVNPGYPPGFETHVSPSV